MSNTKFVVIREAEGPAGFVGDTYHTCRVIHMFDSAEKAKNCVLRLVEEERTCLEETYSNNQHYIKPDVCMEDIREGEFVCAWKLPGNGINQICYGYAAMT